MTSRACSPRTKNRVTIANKVNGKESRRGKHYQFDSDKLGRSFEMNGSNGYKFKYEARKDAR
ncbi:hypothetical protein HanPI659440_Chr05g0214961 [Helianthus annuus]|nr:hypothetical protein HanPI659440_Chr05g0214961 [Helianthus annuus]